MTPKYDENIKSLLSEISGIAMTLPMGKRNQIINRCNKISSQMRKSTRANEGCLFTEEFLEAEAKAQESAKAAIFNAMLKGRKVSQMDCKEFRIEDMRTPVSRLRDKIWREQLPYEIADQWIKTPGGSRIKQYWLTIKES